MMGDRVAIFATFASPLWRISRQTPEWQKRYIVEMTPQWVSAALNHKGIGQAELARQMTTILGKTVDRAAVNKMAGKGGRKPRRVKWEEARAISKITGFPLPDEDVATELTYVRDEDDENGVARGVRYASTIQGASPEVDARSGAGSGQLGQEVAVGEGYTGHRVVDEWVFPQSFHHEMRTQAGLVWIMPVIGNSMEPVLLSGDRVLVDTSHIRPNPDAVYVIDEGAGPEVKQIQIIRGSRPPQIRIISANPSYPPSDRPLEDVRIIGRVCGRVSRM